MHEPVAASGAMALRGNLGRTGRVLLALARGFAIAGGIVFIVLVCMQVTTIVGRKLFAWTVPGDLELLQMGAAFASASFFAWCHMVGGDVKVDFFTDRLRPERIALLDAFGALLVGLFGAVLAWRTGAGALSVGESGETSAILGLPVWIAMAAMVPGFVLLSLCGFYRCLHLMRVALRMAG